MRIFPGLFLLLGATVLLNRSIAAELKRQLGSYWSPSYCKKKNVAWQGLKQKQWHFEVRLINWINICVRPSTLVLCKWLSFKLFNMYNVCFFLLSFLGHIFKLPAKCITLNYTKRSWKLWEEVTKRWVPVKTQFSFVVNSWAFYILNFTILRLIEDWISPCKIPY